MRKDRQIKDALAARAVAHIGEDATALDYVCDYVASGKTLADLAVDLSTEIGTVSRQLVSQTAHNLADDAKARIEAARTECATALAEGTLSISDTTTSDDAAKARLQISARQWLASRFDSAKFGDKAGVQINFDALMLDALRQPPLLRATAILTSGDAAADDTDAMSTLE